MTSLSRTVGREVGDEGVESISRRAASHFPALPPSAGRGPPAHCPARGGEPSAEWRGNWNVAL